MHAKRRSTLVAATLLAATLLAAPGAFASAPSADDPAATIHGILDTLAAKDFDAIGAFVCAEKRAEVTARFDLKTAFASLGEGVDVEALFETLVITTPGRAVEVTAIESTEATVSVTGSIAIDVDEAAARVFVAQLLEAEGEEVTEAILDQWTPLFIARVESSQDLTRELRMVLEDGAWLLCDTLGGGDEPSPAPSLEPAASRPPMDPAAYATLLAAIPADIAASCEPDSYWQVPDLGPEPGEIASAMCDIDGYGGNYVAYDLFESAGTMDAAYDTQLLGNRNMGTLDGPGCPDGPGEGSWEHGRRFCSQFLSDVAARWTHDDLLIMANALNDDGDWAALGAFVQSAGPAAP